MAASSNALAFDALVTFAEQVKQDYELGLRINASPEDQLKRSVPRLVEVVGKTLGRNVSVLSESRVEDVGRPDLAIAVDGLLVGYIELKAPGIGTTQRDFRGQGHNRKQFGNFAQLPNLIYTDARDWTIYHDGKLERKLNVRLGEIDESGGAELTEKDASTLVEMFREFLKWEPIVPSNPKALATQLAPITRMIRTNVADVAARRNSALKSIYDDWKRTLFPEATIDQFADSYAQTVTYGLLLAKLSGAVTLDTREAAAAIRHHSSLLARTLEILTQEDIALELGPGLDLLERTIDVVDPSAIRSDGQDPWLYFYEDFLAEYDPKLRDERGVYYTPAEVVKAQVALVDKLLKTKLGRQLGIGDSTVTVLDPATGTGTYLLQSLQQGIKNGVTQWGAGSSGGTATLMARNLYGFELLVGPYAVAHLRLNQAIQEAGGQTPGNGVNIFLTDTLESPNEHNPLPHSYFEEPLAEERENARRVKSQTQILVCIGNPPYDREQSDDGSDTEHTAGAWIRFGDGMTSAPLESFLEPARQAGAGLHIKNLYNLYVYFWRWALWKVFESQSGPGIVSFITASSYLRGPGFVGMREELRRTFDELWILDLEGEGRGTRKTENVFDIQTPVAIAIGVRYGEEKRETAARVHYSVVHGTRQEKLAKLKSLESFDEIELTLAQEGWSQPLIPKGEGDYFSWPPLTDIFPWQHSGVQLKRTWPVAASEETIRKRWRTLLQSNDRKRAFRETRDRMISKEYPDQFKGGRALPAIQSLPEDAPVPEIVRYGYRTFDRHFVILDSRVGDFYRPPLWKSRSQRQIYLTSMLTEPLGFGGAMTSTSYVPDLHHFSGRGGKDIIPLYRDTKATKPNITSGLLKMLSDAYRDCVASEDLAGYVVGILGHPGYTEKFHNELEVPGPRVPLTKNAALFWRAVGLGKQVIAYQTYAERFPKSIGTTQGNVPKGNAELLIDVPSNPDDYPATLNDVRYDEQEQKLHLGKGVIGNVDPRIWDYEVSGLRVVRSWLGYRVKERSGRKSSPLDKIRPEYWTWEMTQELLQLLWGLEGVIKLEPAQAELLDEIVAGDLYLADELPKPTEAERKPPTPGREQQQSLF